MRKLHVSKSVLTARSGECAGALVRAALEAAHASKPLYNLPECVGLIVPILGSPEELLPNGDVSSQGGARLAEKLRLLGERRSGRALPGFRHWQFTPSERTPFSVW